MTDSTIGGKSGEGSFELGPSLDDLFGDIETPPETDVADRTDEEDVEDVTAADVFEQLQAEGPGTDADDLLEDETPEDIIESADEPAATEDVDHDLLADEDELDALLLTGRTEGEEFLWVETPGDESTDSDADSDGPVAKASDGESTTETASEPEPADEASESGVDDSEESSRPDDGSSSLPEDTIEAFTKEGPEAIPDSPSESDGSATRSGPKSIAVDADDSSTDHSERQSSAPDSKSSDSANETETTRKSRSTFRRTKSKSEKAGGLYARFRSKLSDVV